MLKRRSFLAMLGFAPVAATLKSEPAAAAPEPLVETLPYQEVALPAYKVSIPLKIPLTKEQVELCEMMNMNPVDYAKNLLELVEMGQIESDLDKIVVENAIKQHELMAENMKSSVFK